MKDKVMDRVVCEQYAQMFMWPRINEFARRYIAEANNCFFTVSELCDDFNAWVEMVGYKDVDYKEFYEACKRTIGLIHEDCQGDNLGKFRLNETTYMQIKRMDMLPELKYTWNKED